MRSALPIIAAVVLLAALTYASPKLALVLAGVAIAAMLVARFNGTPASPSIEAAEASGEPEPRPEPRADPRVAAAFNVARRELGQAESEDTSEIEIAPPDGKLRLRVGYHGDAPFIVLRTAMGDETEMAFVIRRHRSAIGLPPIVDNTPIETAAIEYRLRSIPLQSELGSLFDAASNRPRLFRQLLDRGLESDVGELLDHSRYRLEDVVYSGTMLTVLVQPASDPAQVAFVHDCLEFASPIVARLRAFLTEATIPSAQS